MITLTLLGEPRWRSATAEGHLARIDAALLGLLALAGPLPRERVAAWLWPQVRPSNAKLTLRQRLFKLRQLWGHPVVADAGAFLQLAADVEVDAAADRPAPPRGELLGGLDFGDLEAFDSWLAEQREALELRRLDRLVGEAAQLESRGALAQAIALSEQIVARRPQLEHGWRRLIRLHYLRGDRAAAVAVFERFEQQVCREHGLRPAPETLALLNTVEHLPVAQTAMPALLPASLTRTPRLIGRAEPLARVAQAWADGRAVLLLGQGGIGKSRLLETLLDGQGGALMHRARPGLAAMPYACAGQLLAQAHERFAPVLTANTRHELARLQPLFGPAPETPARQEVLWQAAETLLVACMAHGLTLLAVDDLHQADAATLELLLWLLGSEALRPLRWCMAAREHDAEPGAEALSHWLGDSLRVVPVQLSPLPAQQVAELVESLALPASFQKRPDLVAALVRHAGGHPFFTLETLKGLWLAGGGNVDGAAATDAAAALPRPAAAEALIARRLDRLSANARDLLRLLALAGTELRLDQAEQVLAQPLPALAQAWSELAQAQLTQGNDIAHDLVRDCVLARLPPLARQALHLALARVLQLHPGVAPMRRAEHWLGGKAWPEATLALREAAQQARLAGRLAEYELLLLRAAEAAALANDEPARFDAMCLALSVRMMRLGAQAILAPVAQALQQTLGDAQRSRLLAMRCEACLNLGHVEDALAAGREALALARAPGPERFDALVLQGRALALGGQLEQAVEMLEAARDSAPGFADPARLMQAHGALAHGLFSANRHVQALGAQQMALAIAEQMGDATEIAHHLANLAVIAATVGDVALGYSAASAAHRRFETMGMHDGHFFANAVTLSRHAAHLGRLDEAKQALAPVWATDPAHMGQAIHALARVADLGLQLVLGDAHALQSSFLALQRIDVPALLPVVQASVLLARLRHAQTLGQETAPHRAMLIALGGQHPSLRDNPALYREWARWDEPSAALLQLDKLVAAANEAGAHAAARSLRLASIELLLPHQPTKAAQRAQVLAKELPLGMMAGVFLPEAWHWLARALHAGGRDAAARRCLRQGRAWVDAAVLPDAQPGRRHTFVSGPVLRRLLELPLPPPRVSPAAPAA